MATSYCVGKVPTSAVLLNHLSSHRISFTNFQCNNSFTVGDPRAFICIDEEDSKYPMLKAFISIDEIWAVPFNQNQERWIQNISNIDLLHVLSKLSFQNIEYNAHSMLL